MLLGLTMTRLITPWTLLILIFLIEMGTAFETPAFLAVLPELVPKYSASTRPCPERCGHQHLAYRRPGTWEVWWSEQRASRSALAINAATFAAVIFAYARLPPTQPETCLPAERFWVAIRTGWRFTRESPELKATLVRATAFFLFAKRVPGSSCP